MSQRNPPPHPPDFNVDANGVQTFVETWAFFSQLLALPRATSSTLTWGGEGVYVFLGLRQVGLYFANTGINY